MSFFTKFMIFYFTYKKYLQLFFLIFLFYLLLLNVFHVFCSFLERVSEILKFFIFWPKFFSNEKLILEKHEKRELIKYYIKLITFIFITPFIMSPIVYNINNATNREKMASFDYDWTIVNPKEGKTFPTSIDDWVWLYPSVPNTIKKYYNEGYMIVIFTNQSKKWKFEQIQIVMKLLEIPLFIVIANDKSEYKPNPILFNCLFDNKINKLQSFFVGDALGRKSDYSDSDKIFAENIGIKWYSPEDIFTNKTDVFEIPNIPLSPTPEIIIMVGYPGSGKSTISKNICKNENYILIQGDVYKTSSKMIKASLQHIAKSKSIIFDATHSSVKKRKEYVDLALKHNYKAKCIHVSLSLDESYKRNKARCDKEQVPKIAYSIYKKYYEEPNENEGFSLHIV